MMHTYRFNRIFSLVDYAIKQEREKTIWEIWINKDVEEDWPTFKARFDNHKSTKTAPDVDEHEIMNNAFKFIKPIKKDGDS